MNETKNCVEDKKESDLVRVENALQTLKAFVSSVSDLSESTRLTLETSNDSRDCVAKQCEREQGKNRIDEMYCQIQDVSTLINNIKNELTIIKKSIE